MHSLLCRFGKQGLSGIMVLSLGFSWVGGQTRLPLKKGMDEPVTTQIVAVYRNPARSVSAPAAPVVSVPPTAPRPTGIVTRSTLPLVASASGPVVVAKTTAKTATASSIPMGGVQVEILDHH